MTTPYERARAVLQTRTFLEEPVKGFASARLPDDVRRAAETLLRHYPDAGQVAEMAELLPASFAVKRGQH
jgi:hypothetical protein